MKKNQLARKITNTGTLKNIGKFPSIKNKRAVWFESLIERDFLYLIEFDRDVLKYQEQPFKIKYSLNGKKRVYTPDFLIERKEKKQVIEIKPQSKVEKKEFIQFSTFMKDFFAEEKHEFLVVTDLEIRIEPKFSNIKTLWRYAHMPITTKHKILIREFFKDTSTTPFQEFSEFLNNSKEQKELIYSLLFHDCLRIDIKQQITADSQISIGNIH